MTIFKLSKRSLTALTGIDYSLYSFFLSLEGQECPQDFYVNEGLRTIDRQKELLKQRVTRTLNSKHLIGQAVDLVPCIPTKTYPKDDDPAWKEMINWIRPKAKAFGLNLTYGIDWGWDKGHIEIK